MDEKTERHFAITFFYVLNVAITVLVIYIVYQIVGNIDFDIVIFAMLLWIIYLIAKIVVALSHIMNKLGVEL